MSDVDHAAEALALIRKNTNGLPSAQVVAAAIEAHATLALVAATEKVAEQARIANLIAVQRIEFLAGNKNFAAALWNDHIRKGLGL